MADVTRRRTCSKTSYRLTAIASPTSTSVVAAASLNLDFLTTQARYYPTMFTPFLADRLTKYTTLSLTTTAKCPILVACYAIRPKD